MNDLIKTIEDNRKVEDLILTSKANQQTNTEEIGLIAEGQTKVTEIVRETEIDL